MARLDPIKASAPTECSTTSKDVEANLEIKNFIVIAMKILSEVTFSEESEVNTFI